MHWLQNNNYDAGWFCRVFSSQIHSIEPRWTTCARAERLVSGHRPSILSKATMLMDLWFLGQPIGWVSVWPCSEHPYRLLCFGSMSLSSFGVGMSGMSLLHLFSGKIKSLQLWFEMVWACFNQTWTTKGQPCGRILRKGFDTPRERSFVSSDLAASVAFSRRAFSPPWSWKVVVTQSPGKSWKIWVGSTHV